MSAGGKRVRDEFPEDVTEAEINGWKHYFPAPKGELDIKKLELPSDFSPLEWWYYNIHVTGKKTGKDYSIFSSFFRQAKRESRSAEEAFKKKPFKEFAVACTWSVVDVTSKRYYPDNLLDPTAIDSLIKRLDPAVTGVKCVHAQGPLLEMAKKGNLPRPDRQMKRPGVVAKDRLSLNLDDECTVEMVKVAHPQPANLPKGLDFSWKITLNNPKKKVSASFTVTPQVAAVRHGGAGVVNEMFYYYIPRCMVSGKVSIDGEEEEIEGSGWYDREFGGSEDATGNDALDAWTWMSVQLDNGSEFSLFNVVDRDSQKEKEKIGILTKADGTRIVARDFTLSYSNMWTSLNTYVEYPMKWHLVVPSLMIDLHINCAFEHQEFMTILVTGGGFYEGRINAQGTMGGQVVKGPGFLERKNHTTYNDTSGLLKNVGRVVKKILGDMYPIDGSSEYINKVVLGRHCTGKGAPPKVVCDTLFAPVRALIDRGGKSWRSLVLVSSINAMAGEHVDCSRYIAISELLHVGSLIIDDIQDESTVRRGGNCVHLEFGTPTAINAGTGCYFMAPRLAGIEELPPAKAFRLYNLYFDVLRAGHAGQGLDIHGLDYLMPEAVKSGVLQPVRDALEAIHMYKTGGAAGTLCEMACVLCDATDEQGKAMGNFGAQLGLAFQIVDDALNLRGFEGDLKEVGEDIRDGKITYPIITGMERMNLVDREYIFEILQEKTSDTGKISSVIAKLNSVGAIEDCLKKARDLVEDAWTLLEPLVEDSLPKLMMRTFCTYLTERTY